MATYRIRLLRTVSNDAGHEAQVLQRELDVEARSEIEALKAARAQYCALLGVTDCSLYADAFSVERRTWGSGPQDAEPPSGLVSLATALH